jgi:hypothetical protein
MTTPAIDNLNPGFLKLELCASGVRLDEGARARAAELCTPRLADDVAGGLDLILPDDVWVSVPVDEAGSTGSPFLLSESNDQLSLQRNGTRIDVRLVARPAFYERRTSQGTPMWRVGRAYGSCIAVNPAAACGYSLRGAPCALCRGRTHVPIDSIFAMTPQEVTEAVGAAFEEGVAEFVYFNVGHFDTDDGGIAFLEPYVRAMKRHFDTLVAVQIHPPRTNGWIDRTYAMGVDALSYSLELFDEQFLAQHCPGRLGRGGRRRYLEALCHAATIYPSGTVWSELVVGIEPAESTMRGIDALTEIGVVPVLSLHHGAGKQPAAGGMEGAGVTPLVPVYAHLFHAARHAKINIGWISDLSFAVTPLEARFFAGDDARVAVAMQQLYRSRIGNMAARNLARLRRRLRVRRVSDSFDSSHL